MGLPSSTVTTIRSSSAPQIVDHLHHQSPTRQNPLSHGTFQKVSQADRIVRAAVASLFRNGIDPMMVIRWKDIFETLESAVDACETVANVLEGISLKRAHGR